MYKDNYEKALKELLADKNICLANRNLFKKFFTFQEKKLKRMNGLTTLDEPTYKTLCAYISRFKNVNKWFKNKPFKDITQEDFTKVFNDLADGKILNSRGKPHKDINSYVYKIFKSKLFKLAGLHNIIEECDDLTFYKSEAKGKANFISDKDMDLIIMHTAKPKMKLLFTLAYDIGENVTTLLKLKKKDCRREFNEATKEYEYLIHLKDEDIKRSRQERTEPTRLSETPKLLDFMLSSLNDDDYIFVREDNMVRNKGGASKPNYTLTKRIPIGLRSAEITFERIVKKLGIKTIPQGDAPTLKTIRSSMACDCLKKGWTTDEINSRLGHSVTSKVLKPYVTFLALGKKKPKIREYKENLSGLNDELKQQKEINAILDKRIKDIEERFVKMQNHKISGEGISIKELCSPVKTTP